MLVALDKVGPEDVTDILSQFDELDKSRKGLVSTNDIVDLKRQNELPTTFTRHARGRRNSASGDGIRRAQLETIQDEPRGMASLETRFQDHSSRETTSDGGGIGPLSPRQ
jgi:hypothetical protein